MFFRLCRGAWTLCGPVTLATIVRAVAWGPEPCKEICFIPGLARACRGLPGMKAQPVPFKLLRGAKRELTMGQLTMNPLATRAGHGKRESEIRTIATQDG